MERLLLSLAIFLISTSAGMLHSIVAIIYKYFLESEKGLYRLLCVCITLYMQLYGSRHKDYIDYYACVYYYVY